MRKNYGLTPFRIQTIKLERIFADKILAAEFYYNRELYFDVAKHVYDVSIMLDLPSIQALLEDSAELLRMIGYKRLEETRRIGSDLADKPFRDYKIFRGLAANESFETEFQKMQRNYVFNDADILSKDFVIQQWQKLQDSVLYRL